MGLDELFLKLQCTPSQMRYFRDKLVAITGGASGENIPLLLEGRYVAQDSGRIFGDGLYEFADPINSFAECIPLKGERAVEIGDVFFLTDERPLSVTSLIKRRPRAPAVTGYISDKSSFAFSVLFDIPILFKIDAELPRIVKELSSINYEGIYSVGGRRLWRDPQRTIEGAALIYDEFVGYNYCHWLLDWLPRLSLLETIGARIEDINILLTRKPTQFQKQTFFHLGVKENQYITLGNKEQDDMTFIASNSFIGTSTTSLGYLHALHGGSDWAVNFLRTKLVPPSIKGESVRLILNRHQTRRLFFDDQAQKALDAAGFITVFPEDLSVEKQIALFSTAERIVSAHGAGLANIVFCRPQTAILEIFPENYSTSAYFITASAASLRYSCAVATRIEDDTKRGHIRDFDLFCTNDFVSKWLDLI
ncbi:glycosyltransferase family 61 protein [Roseixanthobacter pseudopolyaromaticivorans]|uniref:glycosyltransferase family 61 protein n=1 Tax=Xanthobacteraceae TaxID=335928 RepID=UPI00372C5CCB